MVVTKIHLEWGQGEFPGPIQLQHQSRVEMIRQNMPSDELKKWFMHMDSSRNPLNYDLGLVYDFGDSSIKFMLKNRRLMMPDGSERIIQCEPQTKEGLIPIIGNTNTISRIKKIVSSNIRDRDIIRLDMGSTETELVSELVDAQFRYLEKFGVEASGQILKRDNGGLTHKPMMGRETTVIVDIVHLLVDSQGKKYPSLHTLIDSPHSEKDDRVLCTYHTHYGIGAERPSYKDVETQANTEEKTLIIAARLSENDYLLTEWIPKAGKDPFGEIKRLRKQNEAQYVRDADKFIDCNFEPRRHLLHRNPDGEVHIEPVSFIEDDRGGRVLIGEMIDEMCDLKLHAKSVVPEFGVLNAKFPLGKQATAIYQKVGEGMELQDIFVPQSAQRSGWATATLLILRDIAQCKGAKSIVSHPNSNETIFKRFLAQNGFKLEASHDAGRFDIYRLNLSNLPLY